LIGSSKQASVCSPLDTDTELPGKLSKILLGSSGDNSSPPKIIKHRKPTNPVWALALCGLPAFSSVLIGV
jgi:hypothetical protein